MAMIKKLLFVIAFTLLQTILFTSQAQPTFRYGLGGGVNFSNISVINSYALFEDITQNEYSSTYSSMFSNIGNQFFFHGEFWFKKVILAIKPGTYTYNFKKTDEIIFNTEPLEQENAYLLRYLNIPVELKTVIGRGKLKTFIGASAAYGHLLLQSGSGGQSFIRPKITIGALAGAYYSFENFDFVLTSGYDYGLHNITQKDNRYDTSSNTPYSQSDIRHNNLYITLSILFSLEKANTKKGLDCPIPQKSKKKKYKRK